MQSVLHWLARAFQPSAIGEKSPQSNQCQVWRISVHHFLNAARKRADRPFQGQSHRKSCIMVRVFFGEL
jgi:hypothetical protein